MSKWWNSGTKLATDALLEKEYTAYCAIHGCDQSVRISQNGLPSLWTEIYNKEGTMFLCPEHMLDTKKTRVVIEVKGK